MSAARRKNQSCGIKKKLILPGCCLILIFTIIIHLPVLNVLSVRETKRPGLEYCSRSAYKNGFVISYTHSVNKGRVHDYYSVTSENQLDLERTAFVSYGAGIPEPEETFGAVFSQTEDGYEISNLHRILPQLLMAVGLVAEHSISIGDDEFFLKDYFEPQTSIILQIRRISLARYARALRFKKSAKVEVK